MSEAKHTPGPTIAEAISLGPSDDDMCQRCNRMMHVDPELEPTALCNFCAQEAAMLVPVLLEALGGLCAFVLVEDDRSREALAKAHEAIRKARGAAAIRSQFGTQTGGQKSAIKCKTLDIPPNIQAGISQALEHGPAAAAMPRPGGQ